MKPPLMATHTTYRGGTPDAAGGFAVGSVGNLPDSQRNELRRTKAAEMAEALGMFTQPGSFEAELFNREGGAVAGGGVTLIDLGHLAREGMGSPDGADHGVDDQHD